MWGVLPVKGGYLKAPERDIKEIPFSPLIYGMASCHSLTMIDDVVSGDPMDVKVTFLDRVYYLSSINQLAMFYQLQSKANKSNPLSPETCIIKFEIINSPRNHDFQLCP